MLVDLEGKGSRVRSVPMPAWAKVAVDRWTAAARITEGRLFRAISQKGEVGEALTAQAVYLIVKGYADALGHESILTTERYLGVRQSLTDAPCDHLGIKLEI